MSSLFICATQFQILSALSICKEEKLFDSILVLTNGIEKIPGWKAFLQESNLFKSVAILPDQLPCHRRKHFLSPPKRLKHPSFTERIIGLVSTKTLISSWLEEIEPIIGNEKIHPTLIDQVFISSPTNCLWQFGEFIKSLNRNCKIYGFDEGLGSYLSPSFSEKQIDGIYLFKPHLSKSEHVKIKIQPLDRPEMSYLWELARKCFNLTNLPPRILFFDQWAGMPWVNDKCESIDWKNSSLTKLKLSLLKAISDKLKTLDESLFYIPHPLQSPKATEFFLSKGYKLPPCRTSVPFELLLLCNKYNYSNSIWISIFSSAPIMPLLAFNNSKRCKTILLYHFFEKEEELSAFFQNKELKKLFDEISSNLTTTLRSPKNLVELISQLTSN